MQLNIKNLPDDEESLNLFTSLLVRYPELCTINYSPQGRLLKLTFLLRGSLKKKALFQFGEELSSCIKTYHYFDKKENPLYFKIHSEQGPNITTIEITRDATTLTQKELALIVSYLNQHFNEALVCDDPYNTDEEPAEQDDFIRYLLDNLRNKSPKNKFIAVREEGRVLVFKR